MPHRKYIACVTPSVEQSAISTVRQKPVTEHVSAAAEHPSAWTIVAVVVFLCDSGAGYKRHYLLTYLLTYLLAYLVLQWSVNYCPKI